MSANDIAFVQRPDPHSASSRYTGAPIVKYQKPEIMSLGAVNILICGKSPAIMDSDCRTAIAYDLDE